MFAQLNFSRVVIVLSFVGSAVLGYFVWEQSKALKEAELVLANTPRAIQSMQERALELMELERQVASDGLGGQSDPEQYIRAAAQDKKAAIGAVDVKPLTEQENTKGIVDKSYKVEPARLGSSTVQNFGLDQIANYLYLLEQNSRRVRVTKVEIQPSGSRSPKEHEVLPGTWKFSAEITTRERAD